LNVTSFPGMLHAVEVEGGVLEGECAALLKEFFRKLRVDG